MKRPTDAEEEALPTLAMEDVPLKLRATEGGEGWLAETTTAGMDTGWVREVAWSCKLELATLCASEAEAASKRDALSVSLPLAIDGGSSSLAFAFLALTLSRMPLPEWEVTPLIFHLRPNSPCTSGTLWSWWSVRVRVNAACRGRRWARWARMRPVCWVGVGLVGLGVDGSGEEGGMMIRAGLMVDERCRAESVMERKNAMSLQSFHLPLFIPPIINININEPLPGLRLLRDEIKRDGDVNVTSLVPLLALH